MPDYVFAEKIAAPKPMRLVLATSKGASVEGGADEPVMKLFGSWRLPPDARIYSGVAIAACYEVVMRRLLVFALLPGCIVLSACRSGASLGVAELSPLCAQQYQQAGEHVQGSGEHMWEQRSAAYNHYVSLDCRQEQERLEKSPP